MNWMVCYDYGKDSQHVFSDTIDNKDNVEEALKEWKEKNSYRSAFDKMRVVAIVPVNKDTYENYWEVNDMEKFGQGQDAVSAMRSKIASDVGSYKEK